MAGPNVADFAVRPALTASSLLVHVSYSRASRRRRTSKRRRGRAWKTSWLSSRRKAHPWPTLRYGRRVFRFAALSPHRSSALLLRRTGFPGDARPERRRLRRVSGCARAVCRRLCGELACAVSAVLPALVPPAHRAAVPAGVVRSLVTRRPSLSSAKRRSCGEPASRTTLLTATLTCLKQEEQQDFCKESKHSQAA